MKTQVSPQDAARVVGRSCTEATSAHDLLERVSTDVHQLVPHDGAMWFGVDPGTLLVTSPARVEGFAGSSCAPFWQREFHEQDVSLFADLARRPEPAAALHVEMDGNPRRSARYQDLMRPHGYDDELRGALRTGQTTWGFFGLYRDAGRRHFDADDLKLIRATSPVIAAHLRNYVRSQNPWLGVSQQPGLAMLDCDGRLISANAEALHWLRELRITHDALSESFDLADLGDVTTPDEWQVQVGSPLYALAARARAVAGGLDSRPARLRIRDRHNRWLLLQASCMTPVSGPASESVAVVLEPAMRAEVAPLVIEAFSLTPRERDVLGALAGGGSTAEIAQRLFVSQHTVRDHIKMVFEKVGVSSRAELMAKLFADHYDEPMHADLVEVH